MPLSEPIPTILRVDEKKQGKVTDEHRDEARKLRELWLDRQSMLREMGYGSQEAFGAEFGIGNQAAVGFFLNGKTALSLKAALGFAKGLRCEVSDFSPRLAKLLPHQVRPAGSPEEDQILAAYRALTPELRANLIAYASGLAAAASSTASPTALSRKRPAAAG